MGQTGTASQAVAELVDIYPTLLDLAGLDASGVLHGVSLKPVMEDPAAQVKDVAVSQFPRLKGKDSKMGYAYRSDRYRLVLWRDMDANAGDPLGPVAATELYDYEADPLETRNLADDPAYADARADMEAKAQAFHENIEEVAAATTAP